MDTDSGQRDQNSSGADPRQAELPKWTQATTHEARATDFTVPFVLAAAAIVLGVIGAGIKLSREVLTVHSVSDVLTVQSLSQEVLRIIHSFFPSPDNVVKSDNWVLALAALVGGLATVVGTVQMAFWVIREALTKTTARHLWSNHAIVVGDTALARRVAAGFIDAG
jgi:hypothetical protein